MKMFRRISALVLCLVLLSATCIVASAEVLVDTSKKGSITIYTYESKKDNVENALDITPNGDATGETMSVPEGYTALKGVTYTLYNADGTTKVDGVDPVTTGDDGIATFANLALDTYVVKATSIPANVTSTIEDMKVTIPMTNATDDGLIYDVNVYPKVDSVYGDVTFTKYQADGITKLPDATFKLQKKNDQGNYVDYKIGLKTDANGEINVTDLPAGDYQFVETEAPSGYILDTTPKTFSVPGDSIRYDNGKYIYELDMKNSGELTVSKEADKETAAIDEDVVWTITSSVPYDIATYQKYEITDELDEALEYVSTEVEGLTLDTEYTVSVDGQKVTVALTEAGMKALSGESSLVVKITTKVKADTDLYTGVENTAKLTYTNLTGTTKDPVSPADNIKTNGFQIKKVDSVDDTKVLAGATFELQDDNGNVITFYTVDLQTAKTSIATDENGIAGFYGIANGTYYLVETKAPTGYELIGEKVKIVVEDGYYTPEIDKTIKNVKSSTIINLPQTGGIGVEIVVIAGVLMMIAAAFVIRRKRVNG